MSKLKSLHKMPVQVTCHFIALYGEKIERLHKNGEVFVEDNDSRVKYYRILHQLPKLHAMAEIYINNLKFYTKSNIRIVSDHDLHLLLNAAKQYRIGLDEIYRAAIKEQVLAPESAKNGHFVPNWRQRQTVFALKRTHRRNRSREHVGR